MKEWVRDHHITGIMPRQGTCMQIHGVRNHSGTSSFGMSGINSHMLLGGSDPTTLHEVIVFTTTLKVESGLHCTINRSSYKLSF